MRLALHRRVLFPVLIGLVICAWITLVWLEHSPWAGLFHAHGGAGHAHHAAAATQDPLAAGLLYLAGWLLMVVAMMLPTTLPLVEIFRRLVVRRADGAALLWQLICGYLAAWTAFGVFVWGVNLLLQNGVAAFTPAPGQVWIYAALLFFAAGAFQFSDLKYRCLDLCRTPLGFVAARWRDGSGPVAAWRLGLEHGLYCIGCCWALMLLMFAAGTASVVWMLVLAVLMAAEKNLSWGRRIARPLGGVLLISAALLAARGLTI